MGSGSGQTISPDISFVVPSYRSHLTIAATLRSIQAQGSELRHEVIVVDSSPEPLPADLAELCSNLRLLRQSQRLSAAAARNLGAARARGEWLAFVDADAMLERDWLGTLLSEIRVRPGAVVGGRVANADPQGDAGCVLHWLEFSEFLPGLRGGPRDFLSTSNLLLRRESFLATQGFDERLKMSEDSAFCRGYPGVVIFCSETGVLHQHRQEWAAVLTHLNQLGYWGGVYRRLYRVAGSFLGRWPGLSRLLPLWRLPRIVWRVCSHRPAEALRCLRLLPSLGRGLRAWSRGFERGLRDYS